jgi:Holliday junction resolvase RusA-like endonuclease
MVASRQPLRKALDGDMSAFVIQGEPCSKANSRRLVLIKGRIVPIKSKKALEYSKMFSQQCLTKKEVFTEDLIVCMKIFYKTRRPDLDESLILDLMQGNIYKNDRSIKLKYIEHGLDKESPKTLIVVAPLEMKKEAIDYFYKLLEDHEEFRKL